MPTSGQGKIDWSQNSGSELNIFVFAAYVTGDIILDGYADRSPEFWLMFLDEDKYEIAKDTSHTVDPGNSVTLVSVEPHNLYTTSTIEYLFY